MTTIGMIYCPTCQDFRAVRDTYVLMFGEVVCRVCDQLTGTFEDD